MNENNVKIDLVNPTNPNQIIKSEVLTNQNANVDINQNTVQEPEIEIQNKKPKKKFNLLLIIIILLVVIAAVVGILFFLPKDKPNNQNNNEVNETKKEVNTYEYDIKDVQDEFSIQINEKYKLKAEIINEDISYLYINDKFVSDHLNYYPIKLFMVDDNIIYISGGTDIRSESVYIVNNSNVNVIYELDNINGMVPNNITVKNDSIVIEGSRLSHGPSIIYGSSDISTLLYDNTTWAQYGITEDTIIEATYIYKFENGNLNLIPNISNQVSIKNYLQNNPQ